MTFGKEYESRTQFLRAAKIGNDIWNEASTIAEVMKAYTEAIKKRTPEPKLSMQQWENMLKLAGFEPERDIQMKEIMGDGVRIKWNLDQYIDENNTETYRYQKKPEINLEALIGYEAE